MSSKLDPYRVLQVRPDAGQEEIKVAFRRLARRYHPDRVNDSISNARMIEVNQAWELLGDPVRRAAYDRANGIVVRPRPANGAGADAGGMAGGGPAGRESGPAGDAGEATPTSAAGATDRTAERATSTTAGVPGGEGGALPPPPRPGGVPRGTRLPFGRYEGWTLGEIARVEPEYLEWLVRMPIGWQYRNEINGLLSSRAATPEPPLRTQPRRRGLLGR